MYFKEGRCPGSKALNLEKYPEAFATVSDVEISVCDFTIAFWVRLKDRFSKVQSYGRFPGPRRTLIWGSTSSGKLLALFVRNDCIRYSKGIFEFLSFFMERGVPRNRISAMDIPLSTGSTMGRGRIVVDRDSWVHIAVTCQQCNKVKMYIDGNERNWNGYFGITHNTAPNRYGPPKKTYNIGCRLPFANTLHMIGSIMDLHITGFALAQDDISDLYKVSKPLR